MTGTNNGCDFMDCDLEGPISGRLHIEDNEEDVNHDENFALCYQHLGECLLLDSETVDEILYGDNDD